MKKKKTANRGKKFIHDLCYTFIKVTGALPLILFLRTKLIYKGEKPKRKSNFLVCSNHVGYLDPIIVLTVFKTRRPCFLAADNMFKNKFSAAFFNIFNCIKTDRANFSLSAFHTVIERLNEGQTVVVFPEGQINKTEKGGVLPFKTGILLMAHKGNSPILPIYIIKREKWYQRQKVVIGEQVDISSVIGDNPSINRITSISELLEQKEIELRDYYENFYSKKKQSKQEDIANEQRAL